MGKIYIQGNITEETLEAAQSAILAAAKRAKIKKHVSFTKDPKEADLTYHIKKLADGKRHAIKINTVPF